MTHLETQFLLAVRVSAIWIFRVLGDGKIAGNKEMRENFANGMLKGRKTAGGGLINKIKCFHPLVVGFK